MLADVPVSASQTLVAQLEATIRSAHALLQAGLIDEATGLLAAFSTEVQPKIDQALYNEIAVQRVLHGFESIFQLRQICSGLCYTI